VATVSLEQVGKVKRVNDVSPSSDAEVPVSGGIASETIAEGIARVDPRARVAAGERVTFAVDVERLHFFDRERGARLGEARA
jgi:hypothetical protein